jgi:hypothetical protein
MSETLWKMPVPATALTRGPIFIALSRRQCELSFYIERDHGGEKRINLIFEGVEAYKCTYLTSCSVEMFNTAYGKLVKLGETPWLAESLKSPANTSQPSKELHHLMICFDDGPCHEIICSRFMERVGEAPRVASPP